MVQEPQATIEESAESSQEELESANQSQRQGIENARGSFLSADFLIIFFFAVLIDIIDIALEAFAWLVAPKIIAIVVDLFAFIIIGSWIYTKTKSLEQAKSRVARGLSPDLKKRYQKTVMGKVLKKMGLSMLGEMIPFVGIVPFWTLRVFSVLKQK